MKVLGHSASVLLLVLAGLILLSGCSVGPVYQRPEATTIPDTYAGTKGEWKIAEPRADLPKGRWWEIFGDAELDRLQEEAMASNQDIRAAVARFEQARAVADIVRSGFFPQTGSSFLPARTRDSLNRPSGGKPGQTYNNFILSFDLSYEVDLWGRVRHAVEASTAQVRAGADDIEALKLAIQAEIASDYFSLRALDSEKELLATSIEAYRKSLELTRNRRARGMVSDLDVAQAETVLQTAEAQLADTTLQRLKMQNALAVLAGKNASVFLLAEKTSMPASIIIPTGLPSELLERRPDIAAAERRMAAANANVGVATAAFFPVVRFQGLAGLQSGDVGTLFDWPSRFWGVGPSLSLPLFDGGQRLAGLRQSKASYEETVAKYRQTVLTAFAEVENNIAAGHLLAREYERETAALLSARRQLEIAETRYKSGLVTYLEVATAQNTSLGIERTAVRLKGQQLIAAVALIKALGGGWGDRNDTAQGDGISTQAP